MLIWKTLKTIQKKKNKMPCTNVHKRYRKNIGCLAKPIQLFHPLWPWTFLVAFLNLNFSTTGTEIFYSIAAFFSLNGSLKVSNLRSATVTELFRKCFPAVCQIPSKQNNFSPTFSLWKNSLQKLVANIKGCHTTFHSKSMPSNWRIFAAAFYTFEPER